PSRIRPPMQGHGIPLPLPRVALNLIGGQPRAPDLRITKGDQTHAVGMVGPNPLPIELIFRETRGLAAIDLFKNDSPPRTWSVLFDLRTQLADKFGHHHGVVSDRARPGR